MFPGLKQCLFFAILSDSIHTLRPGSESILPRTKIKVLNTSTSDKNPCVSGFKAVCVFPISSGSIHTLRPGYESILSRTKIKVLNTSTSDTNPCVAVFKAVSVSQSHLTAFIL